MIIETKRLYLRKLRQSDYNNLCEIMQDNDVMYAYEGSFTNAEVHAWLDKQLTRYNDDGFALNAVY